MNLIFVPLIVMPLLNRVSKLSPLFRNLFISATTVSVSLPGKWFLSLCQTIVCACKKCSNISRSTRLSMSNCKLCVDYIEDLLQDIVQCALQIRFHSADSYCNFFIGSTYFYFTCYSFSNNALFQLFQQFNVSIGFRYLGINLGCFFSIWATMDCCSWNGESRALVKPICVEFKCGSKAPVLVCNISSFPILLLKYRDKNSELITLLLMSNIIRAWQLHKSYFAFTNAIWPISPVCTTNILPFLILGCFLAHSSET